MQTSNNIPFNTRVMSQITAVPNAGTDLTAKDCIVYAVHVCNNTVGAVTFTLQDKQGTPLKLFSAYSIPANSFLNVSFNEGIPCTGGLTWSASAATSLYGYIDARAKL